MIRISTIKDAALALSIAIVLNVFVGVGLSTFYPSPQYEDFCPIHLTRPVVDPASPESVKTQLESEQCSRLYTEARQNYDRIVFLVFLVAGLVAIGAGSAISNSSAVSAGLSIGGVFAFLVGTARGWGGIEDILRFVIVGVVLAVLIWFGYRARRNYTNTK